VLVGAGLHASESCGEPVGVGRVGVHRLGVAKGSCQSGMHSRVLGVAGAESGKQMEQLVAFSAVQPSAQRLLDPDGCLEGFVKQLPACGGEHDGVRPTVARMGLSAHEPPVFEFVDEGDHPVGVKSEGGSDLPLRLAICGGEGSQQPEVPRLYSQRRKRQGELVSDLESQSRHDEAHAGGGGGGVGGRYVSHWHVSHQGELIRSSYDNPRLTLSSEGVYPAPVRD
jgi:hypothetical protein